MENREQEIGIIQGVYSIKSAGIDNLGAEIKVTEIK